MMEIWNALVLNVLTDTKGWPFMIRRYCSECRGELKQSHQCRARRSRFLEKRDDSSPDAEFLRPGTTARPERRTLSYLSYLYHPSL